MGGDGIYTLLSERLRDILRMAAPDAEELQEIRLRVGQPLLLRYGGKEVALTSDGELCRDAKQGLIVTAEELRETMECISGYSLYAFDEEMRQGFMTVPGGHRIGVAGKTVMEGGKVQGIHHISCVNIRLSHEIRGCADPVMPYVIEDGEICHTLVISPPRCGKSTLLRDMIRQISDGGPLLEGRTVGVVDERSEIAGSYLGVPQNDVGRRTDVLDCCSKTEGMMMLLRSMSPQVIAVDEIGNNADREALESVFHCGCRLLATAHGSSVDDIKKSPLLREMVYQHMFERYIILGAHPTGSVREIFDCRGTVLCRGG